MPAGIPKPKPVNGLIDLDECYNYCYRINKADKLHEFLKDISIKVDNTNKAYITIEDFNKFEEMIRE